MRDLLSGNGPSEPTPDVLVRELDVTARAGVLTDLVGDDGCEWGEDTEAVGAADFVEVEMGVGRGAAHVAEAADVAARAFEDIDRRLYRVPLTDEMLAASQKRELDWAFAPEQAHDERAFGVRVDQYSRQRTMFPGIGSPYQAPRSDIQRVLRDGFGNVPGVGVLALIPNAAIHAYNGEYVEAGESGALAATELFVGWASRAPSRGAALRAKYADLSPAQRAARIDELSNANYMRRLQEELGGQEYVYRYLSEDGLATSLKYNSVRGYTTTQLSASSQAVAEGGEPRG